MSAELARDGPGNLEDAWQIARAELLEPLGRAPTDWEIAAHIAQSGSLRFIAGLYKYQVSPAVIVGLRRGYRPETGIGH